MQESTHPKLPGLQGLLKAQLQVNCSIIKALDPSEGVERTRISQEQMMVDKKLYTSVLYSSPGTGHNPIPQIFAVRCILDFRILWILGKGIITHTMYPLMASGAALFLKKKNTLIFSSKAGK